jgi:hypothetical protein
MRLVLALLALVTLTGAAPEPRPVSVSVTRKGDAFIAEYSFPRSQPAWGFFRSTPAIEGKSWRLQSWQVLTPGVQLQRRGKFDALVAARGNVPRTVRVRVIPFTGEVEANYVPAMRLGGNSVALFDGHFSVFSVDRAGVLDTLPYAFDHSLVGDSGTAIRFRGSDLRIAGDVDGYRSGNSEGAYGLYDVPHPILRGGVATVIDGDLPKWLGDDLASYSPRTFEALTEGLGPSGVTQPTILAAWEGTGREGASMNGGTLKGLILMRFEGEAAQKPLPALTDLAHWFIAHEASHFWLGQSVHYKTPLDSWIMEGGADLLAIRTVHKLDSRFDPTKKLNELLRECAGLADEPVATALERNEHRAYYACGAVFALVAEKESGGDFYSFIRGLIDASRDDRELTSSEWYAALDRASGSPRQSMSIRKLVEHGAPDPKAALAALLNGAGIPYVLNSKGVPQLQ